jgi:DHA2 family multidrug resistance protein
LELIDNVINRQVEVVSFINIASMVGVVLLVLSVLPLLHRSSEEHANARDSA